MTSTRAWATTTTDTYTMDKVLASHERGTLLAVVRDSAGRAHIATVSDEDNAGRTYVLSAISEDAAELVLGGKLAPAEVADVLLTSAHVRRVHLPWVTAAPAPVVEEPLTVSDLYDRVVPVA